MLGARNREPSVTRRPNLAFDPGQHACREQRVAAQLEEVGCGIDLALSEQLTPDQGELALGGLIDRSLRFGGAAANVVRVPRLVDVGLVDDLDRTVSSDTCRIPGREPLAVDVDVQFAGRSNRRSLVRSVQNEIAGSRQWRARAAANRATAGCAAPIQTPAVSG